jgi:hypothetical protein
VQRAPFTALARVYDAIMQDVPYDDWVAFALREATARGWRGGHPRSRLRDRQRHRPARAERGFEVVGLDASHAMLEVARAKLPGVRSIHGDVRDARLPGASRSRSRCSTR